ncbi:MAG TPA: tetratricopeptide repeat protein [Tepidisphaeraceae bacterium]|nr:tetratricopeptide repeat protein [Tepidisphaeraceae bacterium]
MSNLAAHQNLQAGRLNEGETLRPQIQAGSPPDAEAMKLLCLSMLRRGRAKEAVDLIQGAVTAGPDVVEYRNILGGILASQGRLDEAITVLQDAVFLDPHYPPALYNLGNALAAKGLWDQAIDAFERATAVEPRYAEAHHNLAGALRASGRIELAILAYRRAVEVRPDFYHAWNNLGMVLLSREQFAAAAEAFAKALPSGQAEPFNNLGNALQGLRRFKEAVDAYQQALQLKPGYAEALCNLASALRELGRLDEASVAAKRAVLLRPDMLEARLALALTCLKGRQWQQAVETLQTVLRIDPNHAGAHCYLGNALAKLDQPDEAIAAYERAAALDPKSAVAHAELGNALRDRGQIDQALTCYRKAAMLSDESWIGSAAVYALYFHPDYDPARILQESLAWNHRYAAPLTPACATFGNTRQGDRRLKLGYVSPDFRAHAIGLFLLRLMENHDHESFELFLYSGVRNPDEMTGRFRRCADVWRETASLADQQLAERIRSDQIDVLVDVTMHLHDGRLLAFARKPAPVQITYLAHPGTTGLAAMDYRLGDRYMDPPDNDRFHTEKTLRLSGSYFCYDPMGADLPVNPLPALKRNAITFGSMNNFSKVNDRVLQLWSRVLGAVPDSHLLVLAPPGIARRRLSDRMQSLGISLNRLEFEGHRPRLPYMELFHRIDICLDTFPYTGHTTTLDALWMGVPVVTLPGATSVSRGAMSILSHLQMPWLAAQSPEEYVTTATNLAGDLPRLRELRATLRDRLAASPLMDGASFARSFADAFRTAWRRWCDPEDAITAFM